MGALRFFSKVAFICNLFFLFAVTLHFVPLVREESLVATIVIIGYFLAVFIFNPTINILYLIFLFSKRSLYASIPKWLVVTNFIFLVIQILYIILILNDTFYY